MIRKSANDKFDKLFVKKKLPATKSVCPSPDALIELYFWKEAHSIHDIWFLFGYNAN